MNILYISNLTGSLFAGPNYSVPAQIRAQSEIDNVFWYNLSAAKLEEWEKIGCKNLEDISCATLDSLPTPFNNPDIAVIEEVYCYPFCSLITEIRKKGIPYVIIPRSVMTKQAQSKRKLKKIIGNLLFFNKFIRGAAAIQYLTEEEKIESSEQWNINSFVIPNGINKKAAVKERFSENGIRAAYIGRYEIYQKGLDLMLDAIAAEQDLLRKNGFLLNMYGHNQENTVAKLMQKINDSGICDIVKVNGSVFGEDKEKVLLDSDVFIMTSRFEGHPMGMIEALSYGLPCIATLGTNLLEEVKSYDAGWVAENNVLSIREALRQMVAQAGDLQIKSENAIRLADVYSWDKIARDSHEIYERILRKHKNEH